MESHAYELRTGHAMDENGLREKLRRIEALFAGAGTPGERDAAEAAKDRILKRLEEIRQQDPPVEYRMGMNDMWELCLMTALLRRYKLTPYRYRRQRYTTVMVRAPLRFLEETLWPEFTELTRALRTYLTEVTDRVIAETINKDLSDAEEVPSEPPKLESGPTS